MEPPGHQKSMSSYDPKLFFDFLAPKNHPLALNNHRNAFLSSRGTRWTLKFRSSSIISRVITSFRHFSALDLTSEVTGWPRTLSLHTNRLVSWRATRSFFFPRSSKPIRGETIHKLIQKKMDRLHVWFSHTWTHRKCYSLNWTTVIL